MDESRPRACVRVCDGVCVQFVRFERVSMKR